MIGGIKPITVGGGDAHGAHLNKPDNDYVLAVQGNIAEFAGMEARARARDYRYGIVSAYLSPDVNLTHKQAMDFKDRLCAEFNADPHTTVVHEHGKTRDGSHTATHHFHFDMEYVDRDGRAMDLSHSYARIERLCREFEYDLGLKLTPGHHNVAVMKCARPEVAEAMRKAGLHEIERPKATYSEGTLRKAQRDGFKITKAKPWIEDVFAKTNDLAHAREVLERNGFAIIQGDKKVVVMTADGEHVGGSVERLSRRTYTNVQAKEFIHVAGHEGISTPRSHGHVPEGRERLGEGAGWAGLDRSGGERAGGDVADGHGSTTGACNEHGGSRKPRYPPDAQSHDATAVAAGRSDAGPSAADSFPASGHSGADRSTSQLRLPRPEGPAASVIRASVYTHQGQDYRNEYGYIVLGRKTFDVEAYKRDLEKILGSNRADAHLYIPAFGMRL